MQPGGTVWIPEKEQLWNSPIQGRTQCEFKTELFRETGETSLSSQILKNQLFLRSRIQTEMAKSKSKTTEILTLHQLRLELGKLEAAVSKLPERLEQNWI